MQPTSMEQIDRAALALLRALAEHGQVLAPYFEPGHLAGLEQDLVRLRQALLAVQMGPLYWDAHQGDRAD